MIETHDFQPNEPQRDQNNAWIEQIRAYFETGSLPERTKSIQRLLRNWRTENISKKRFPETDDRILRRLYKESRDVWELLSRFSDSFRFPRNKDGQLSYLIPDTIWNDARRVYTYYEQKILALEAKPPPDLKAQLKDYRTVKIPKLLELFHNMADPYIVAEGQLAARHPDLFPRLVRSFYIDAEGTILTSEEDAVTIAKKLLALLLPDEYRHILNEAITAQTQVMDPVERKALTETYRSVFKEL